jgi:hypothetical protein
MAEDWASRAADETDRKRDADQQREKRASQIRDIMEQQGPLAWKQVVSGIHAQIGEFNKREGDKLAVEREDENSITVISALSTRQRNVTASLGKDYRVNFYGQVVSNPADSRAGSIAMYVTDENKISFKQDWKEKSTDDVVASILNALI